MTTDEAQFYGLCVQTAAIVASAAGVILTIMWNVRIARRRATLDLVIQEQTNQAIIAERTAFVIAKQGGNLVQWTDKAKASADETVAIRAVLNRYELVAIGIKQNTLDKKIYKLWCRTTLVNDWIELKPFVMQIRQDTRTPAYFCEVEFLARMWANESELPHV